MGCDLSVAAKPPANASRSHPPAEYLEKFSPCAAVFPRVPAGSATMRPIALRSGLQRGLTKAFDVRLAGH